jgi:hypothetical protein
MDKQQIGSLGLSRKSVEQLERVIDTADTVLYPAHLMIGGWRMFLAAIALAIYGLCYFVWWVFDSIYHNGVISTVTDICHSVAGLVREFPYVSAIVVLVIVVPVFLLLLPIFRWCTALLFTIWLRFSFAFSRPAPGLYSGAEIIARGYDPNNFDFEEINGVIYGRRRGA